MSAITTMLLLVVAFVLWQSGMTFFAFLALIVGVLLALTPSKPSASSAPQGYATYPGYPAPVMVGGSKIPESLKIKIKPKWGDTTNLEDWAQGVGIMINTVGRTIAWVLRGFRGPGDGKGGDSGGH